MQGPQVTQLSCFPLLVSRSLPLKLRRAKTDPFLTAILKTASDESIPLCFNKFLGVIHVMRRLVTGLEAV